MFNSSSQHCKESENHGPTPLPDDQLDEALAESPAEETEATLAKVTASIINSVPLQLLGPLKAWGATISLTGMNLETLKSVIEDTGQHHQCRFPGYLWQDADGTMNYHITRYPRRANLAVPPLQDYRDTLHLLKEALKPHVDSLQIQEDTLYDTPQIRAVLGLREGYFDQRKKDILDKISSGVFSDVQEVKEAIVQRLGDLTCTGIALDAITTVTELKTTLEELSLSILHTPDEVSEALGPEARIKVGEIFSVSPDYTYSEEAAIIEAPATEPMLSRLIQYADTTKQARFTCERLDTGAVVNIEIVSFSDSQSARMA